MIKWYLCNTSNFYYAYKELGDNEIEPLGYYVGNSGDLDYRVFGKKPVPDTIYDDRIVYKGDSLANAQKACETHYQKTQG